MQQLLEPFLTDEQTETIMREPSDEARNLSSANRSLAQRSPISFADREYLHAIYVANHGNLVIRASRQVEKSTFLAATVIFEACQNPESRILFVAPRRAVPDVSRDRLIPMIQESPLVRRRLFGPRKRMRISISNLPTVRGCTSDRHF